MNEEKAVSTSKTLGDDNNQADKIKLKSDATNGAKFSIFSRRSRQNTSPGSKIPVMVSDNFDKDTSLTERFDFRPVTLLQFEQESESLEASLASLLSMSSSNFDKHDEEKKDDEGKSFHDNSDGIESIRDRERGGNGFITPTPKIISPAYAYSPPGSSKRQEDVVDSPSGLPMPSVMRSPASKRYKEEENEEKENTVMLEQRGKTEGSMVTSPASSHSGLEEFTNNQPRQTPHQHHHHGKFAFPSLSRSRSTSSRRNPSRSNTRHLMTPTPTPTPTPRSPTPTDTAQSSAKNKPQHPQQPFVDAFGFLLAFPSLIGNDADANQSTRTVLMASSSQNGNPVPNETFISEAKESNNYAAQIDINDDDIQTADDLTERRGRGNSLHSRSSSPFLTPPRPHTPGILSAVVSDAPIDSTATDIHLNNGTNSGGAKLSMQKIEKERELKWRKMAHELLVPAQVREVLQGELIQQRQNQIHARYCCCFKRLVDTVGAIASGNVDLMNGDEEIVGVLGGCGGDGCGVVVDEDGVVGEIAGGGVSAGEMIGIIGRVRPRVGGWRLYSFGGIEKVLNNLI